MHTKIVLIFYTIILNFSFFTTSDCATRKSWKRSDVAHVKEEKSQLNTTSVSVTNYEDSENRENSIIKIVNDNSSGENTTFSSYSHEISSKHDMSPEVDDESPFEDDIAKISVDQSNHLVNVSFTEQSLKEIFTGNKCI